MEALRVSRVLIVMLQQDLALEDRMRTQLLGNLHPFEKVTMLRTSELKDLSQLPSQSAPQWTSSHADYLEFVSKAFPQAWNWEAWLLAQLDAILVGTIVDLLCIVTETPHIQDPRSLGLYGVLRKASEKFAQTLKISIVEEKDNPGRATVLKDLFDGLRIHPWKSDWGGAVADERLVWRGSALSPRLLTHLEDEPAKCVRVSLTRSQPLQTSAISAAPAVRQRLPSLATNPPQPHALLFLPIKRVAYSSFPTHFLGTLVLDLEPEKLDSLRWPREADTAVIYSLQPISSEPAWAPVYFLVHLQQDFEDKVHLIAQMMTTAPRQSSPALQLITTLKKLNSMPVIEGARLVFLSEALSQLPRFSTRQVEQAPEVPLSAFTPERLESLRKDLQAKEMQAFEDANPFPAVFLGANGNNSGPLLPQKRSPDASSSHSQKKRKRLSSVPMLTSQELKFQLKNPHSVETPISSEPPSPNGRAGKKDPRKKSLNGLEQQNKECLEKVIMRVMKKEGLSKSHPEFKESYKQLYTRVKFEVRKLFDSEEISEAKFQEVTEANASFLKGVVQ